MEPVLAVWPAELEIRARGRKLAGSFPYGSTAVVADRGKVRKERIRARAFSWQLDEFAKLQGQLADVVKEAEDTARAQLLREELARRNVDLLRGHSFDKPIASMLNGSLRVEDSATALRFEADLPANPPSWVEDTVRAVDAGLLRGVSPGFRVPPRAVVPNAEELVEEAGTGVQIREVRQAVLYELSLVTRPAYPASQVDARAFFPEVEAPPPDDTEFLRWL